MLCQKDYYLAEGGMYMNKSELIAKMSEETELTKKDTEKTLNAFMNVVTEELSQKGKVQLIGFGTFETSDRAARKGRNPSTGEEMDIPATTVPKFKAGANLKRAVK